MKLELAITMLLVGLPAHAEEGDGCLRGASLQERFDDAWRRWAVEGARMRDCDAEALLEASEAIGRCQEVSGRTGKNLQAPQLSTHQEH